MEVAARINQTKYNVFQWRYELSLSKKLALALGVACLIGLAAQVRIPIPWSPVPITGQTFAVLSMPGWVLPDFPGLLAGQVAWATLPDPLEATLSVLSWLPCFWVTLPISILGREAFLVCSGLCFLPILS